MKGRSCSAVKSSLEILATYNSLVTQIPYFSKGSPKNFYVWWGKALVYYGLPALKKVKKKKKCGWHL